MLAAWRTLQRGEPARKVCEMQVSIRLSGELATKAGRPRFTMSMADRATVADLLQLLQQEYPQLWPRMDTAVPIISGKHVSQTTSLADGQEVAFLLPIAGG
jgi:molybdopterin synthase catalytic subunit/molybdopterin synthase sulfur carrier subunit